MAGESSLSQRPERDWRDSVWIDLVAFAGGLGIAWHGKWQTTDLVWSLWLSSLVIGYAIILWTILGPGLVILFRICRHGFGSEAGLPAGGFGPGGTPIKGLLLLGAIAAVGGAFMIAFFTVHFGGFHYVHSVFLRVFFPLDPGGSMRVPDLTFFTEVFRRYGWFLPAAALAERGAFRSGPPEEPAPVDDLTVTPAAIAARKARNASRGGMTGLMAPYKNVVRLHLLIFFFAGVHFAGIDNFLVYAVVYAVYFFLWRVLRRAPPG